MIDITEIKLHLRFQYIFFCAFFFFFNLDFIEELVGFWSVSIIWRLFQTTYLELNSVPNQNVNVCNIFSLNEAYVITYYDLNDIQLNQVLGLVEWTSHPLFMAVNWWYLIA